MRALRLDQAIAQHVHVRERQSGYTETAKIEGGYAKEVSADYLQKQKQAVNKSLAQADLVITTYALAHRDRETLEKVGWHRVVLGRYADMDAAKKEATRWKPALEYGFWIAAGPVRP